MFQNGYGFPLLILLIFFISACSGQTPPEPDSDEYRDAVSSFYLALSAVESGESAFAVEKMTSVAEQYPREAAAWANLGVFAMRRGDLQLANDRLQRAAGLAGRNGEIRFLMGILASRQGDIARAIRQLRRGVTLEPGDPRIRYALVLELEREDTQAHGDSIRVLLEELSVQEPDNIAVMIESARMAVKLNDTGMLETSLDRLLTASESWPEEIRTEFTGLRQDILDVPVGELTFEVAYLRNSLNTLPQLQSDFDRIQIPPTQVGFLITGFLWLPEPGKSNAPADEQITFESTSLGFEGEVFLIKALSLGDDTVSTLVGINGNRARLQDGRILPFPSTQGTNPSARWIEEADYNYDFMDDLIFAGPGGIRLYEQQSDSLFRDVTGAIGLPSSVLNDSYDGVWKADIDLDGDLDLILARETAAPLLLRNNGDETFGYMEYFPEAEGSVDFGWGDLDSDGDPDAALLTENGELLIYLNERAGIFELIGYSPPIGRIRDLEVADLDSDSRFDLVLLGAQSIGRVSFNTGEGSFYLNEVTALPDAGTAGARLLVNDFDNNGGLDLIVSTPSGSRLWLSDEELNMVLQERTLPGRLMSVTDLNGDLRLDITGLDGEGSPIGLLNSGTAGYNGRIIRPRASGPSGDRRINSFGIGGEIEIRSGLLYHKEPINDPYVHFGLGSYEEAAMLRIVWPNGTSQAEFAELGYGTTILNEQILKGSCPWIFTFNGKEMEFVTDFLWRTALGLRINAQGGATVIHSIDWVSLDGDQLRPREGYYDVRITAELWETHFFDHVSLMVVDHPSDTELLVDERFVLPAPEQKLYPVAPLRPVARAVDQRGRDVTGIVLEQDGDYVDGFDLTAYQGLAEEHYVEIELGEGLPEEGPVYLVANGWIYPTDSSINVAIGQGSNMPPHGLLLQVPDGEGGWKTVRDDIGFPAGKRKTILIDLADLPLNEIPSRVRLATNMEIYWDRLAWTEGRNGTELSTEILQPEVADLRYRGFSVLNRNNRFEPEIPDYGIISGTTPKWLDLEGQYTRFGDVRELVRDIDDRYVIMNAGDELLFRFPTPAPPPEGWKRDFVLIGDGWVKDGDYNTGFSKTVLPLPYHGMEEYSAVPKRLEDDPVYRRFSQDWAEYHTRYITPAPFQSALKFDVNAVE